ncbi:hypothetical protein PG995_011988 [Apiospora arundinis]
MLAKALFLVGALPIAIHALSLNITALTANSAGVSIFECWTLKTTLETSTQPGLIGAASSFLGNVANMTYSTTPVGFNSGIHHAPRNQKVPPVFHIVGTLGLIPFSRWVVPIAGMGIATLPGDPGNNLYFAKDMPSGFFFAGDTVDLSKIGHGTYNPGYNSAIILQIPTLDNKVPEHTVLHAGYCTSKDTSGLAALS